MKAIQWSFRRIEKKYLISVDQYQQLMDALKDYLVPDDYPEGTICNIYYDTPDHQLIRQSLQKPIYKEKFRLRSYGVPTEGSPVFLEIKKKFNGIVYKRRVQTDTHAAMDYLGGGSDPNVNDPQIMNEIHWFCRRYPLVPGMFVAYDRQSFKAKENPELRITFDRDIRYRNVDMDMTHGDYGLRLLPEDTIVMEIKIPGSAPVWLSNTLSSLQIYPTSFSKYGRAYLKTIGSKTNKYKMGG